jgi:hypothetical protein
MMAVYRVLRYQPLSAPAWARGMTPRTQRIALLLFLMNALSLTDLGCTLFAHRLGMLQEMNPVAAAFLMAGLEPSFICYKLVLMIAGSTMLWKLRGSTWALPACCVLVGAYVGLTVLWYEWVQMVTPVLEASLRGK